MESFGSAIRFSTSEEAALAVAQQHLAAHHNPDRYYRAVPLEYLAGAVSLTELFAHFRQVLVRDVSGEVVATTGQDGRFYAVRPLLDAVASCVVPGSWYAYRSDDDADVRVWWTDRSGTPHESYVDPWELPSAGSSGDRWLEMDDVSDDLWEDPSDLSVRTVGFDEIRAAMLRAGHDVELVAPVTVDEAAVAVCAESSWKSLHLVG
jgi:hypothetical protein